MEDQRALPASSKDESPAAREGILEAAERGQHHLNNRITMPIGGG